MASHGRRIQALLQRGDVAGALQIYAKAQRGTTWSQTTHDAIARACAEIPDARAAHAVLSACEHPSEALVTQVVSAQCREHGVDACNPLLATLAQRKIKPSTHMLRRIERMHRRRNQFSLSKDRRSTALTTLYNADTAQGPGAEEIQTHGRIYKQCDSEAHQHSAHGTDSGQDLGPATSSTNAAAPASEAGDVRDVQCLTADLGTRETSEGASTEDSLVATDARPRMDASVLLSTVEALLLEGRKGLDDAINLMQKWLDDASADLANASASLTQSRSTTARFVTLCSTLISEMAVDRSLDSVALYDSVSSLDIDMARSSIHLTGAYMKALRHAFLPTSQVLSRIRSTRTHMVQFDEQCFSLALSAILRSTGDHDIRWDAARQWRGVMRQAGIPWSEHSYRFLAAQIRYTGCPQSAASLLLSMDRSQTVPSATTYALLIESCILRPHQRYSIMNAGLSTNDVVKILAAIEEHMVRSNVKHTGWSELALASAYAHVGVVQKAVALYRKAEESARAAHDSDSASSNGRPNRRQRCHSTPLGESRTLWASRIIHHLAHARGEDNAAPLAALSLYERAKSSGYIPNGRTLESLLAACSRLGKRGQSIRLIEEIIDSAQNTSTELTLSTRGVEQIMIVLAAAPSGQAWDRTKGLLQRNIERLAALDERTVSDATVGILVTAFARAQESAVCEEIVAITGIDPPYWRMSLRGEDFRRCRAGLGSRSIAGTLAQ